jgi:hypothetical protein
MTRNQRRLKKGKKMAEKRQTKKIKVRDLKAKKDAKGGVATNVSTRTSSNVGSSPGNNAHFSPHC